MADPNQDPFAAMGGGVEYAPGAWAPKGHPLAQGVTPAPAAAQPGMTPPGATPPGTPATNIPQQAGNAQTYSQTPGAAPTSSTTNQGTQDVVRNSYLQQATQGTQVNTSDPNFRQQADPFAAAVQRQKRDYISDQAESGGPYATGALRGQARMASERAGQAIGTFEADLVARELQNRRAEIQQALAALGSNIESDQGRALQKQLADMNAELTRLGITTNANLTAGDQALRERLARLQDAYNYSALNQNQRQFADTLGFNIGVAEADNNYRATQALL